MRYLLDTHVALFAWLAPEQLSERARQWLADPSEEFVFSQVSTWEIVLKYHIGKLPLPEDPRGYLPARIQQFGFFYEPMRDADLFGILELPRPHQDPFDWLLAATARRLGLPLLSRDAALRRYPITVVW